MRAGLGRQRWPEIAVLTLALGPVVVAGIWLLPGLVRDLGSLAWAAAPVVVGTLAYWGFLLLLGFDQRGARARRFPSFLVGRAARGEARRPLERDDGRRGVVLPLERQRR